LTSKMNSLQITDRPSRTRQLHVSCVPGQCWPGIQNPIILCPSNAPSQAVNAYAKLPPSGGHSSSAEDLGRSSADCRCHIADTNDGVVSSIDVSSRSFLGCCQDSALKGIIESSATKFREVPSHLSDAIMVYYTYTPLQMHDSVPSEVYSSN
jgi:hypothetical protein